MLRSAASVFSLLLSMVLLLMGIGLLGTLVGLRAGLEHFPVGVIGMVMSAYFVGYFLGTYLCPPLIRRTGHIRAFAAFAAVAAASTTTYSLWVDPITWTALRVLTGICLVGLYMVIESWLNTLAPAEGRAAFFSIYIALTLVALGAGQYLLLLGGIDGYRLFAYAAILVSLSLVPVALTRVRQPEVVETPRLSLRVLYGSSPLGITGTVVAGLITGAFWGMGPVFAQRIALSNAEVAAFMSATIFGGALLQWPIGHLSDRHDRRGVLIGVSFGAALLAVAGWWSADGSHSVLIGIAFLYGGFAFTLYALSVAHVNDQLAPGEVLDATRTLLQLFGLGAAIGPAVAGGFMGRFGPGSLMLFFAVVLSALGVFALYRRSAREAPPVEEQGEFVTMVRTSPVLLDADPRIGEVDETQTGESSTVNEDRSE